MPSKPSTSTESEALQDQEDLLGDFVTPDQAQLAGDALADELQSILDEARATTTEAIDSPRVSADVKKHSADAAAVDSHASQTSDPQRVSDAPASAPVPHVASPSQASKSNVDPAKWHDTPASPSNQENVVPSEVLPHSSQAPVSPSKASAPAPTGADTDDLDAMNMEACFATPEEVAESAADAIAVAEAALEDVGDRIRDLSANGPTPALEPLDESEADEMTAELEGIRQQLHDTQDEVDHAVSPTTARGVPNDRPGPTAKSSPVTPGASSPLPPRSEPATSAVNAPSNERVETELPDPPDDQAATFASPAEVASAAEPTSAAASTPPGPASLNQIDEFLAGHADHAVSGDFETAHDVMAAEQAASSSPAEAPKPVPVPVPAAVVSVPPTAPIQPSPPPSVAVPSTAAVPPVGGAAEPEKPATAGDAGSRLKLAHLVRRAVIGGAVATSNLAFQACALINVPLAKASEQTRKMVGYAGLITAFNGSILLLIKFISSMKG